MRLPVLSASSAASITPGGEAARTLVNAVRGEVRLSAHERMLYATDASLYQVEPLAVVIPADEADLIETVRACAGLSLPLLPRGGGTSLAGQCTNRAVVVDVSPTMRRMPWHAGERALVEPGLTIEDCNDMLAKSGMFFAADPATARHATFGGCIGNNAAGSRSILYGRTSESVIGLDCVLADGSRAWFGPCDCLPQAFMPDAASRARGAMVTRRVLEIVRAHAGLIRERFPKTVRRNAGYGLDMVLKQLDAGVREEEVNLAPMLCGSEGTLAVTLRALVRLHPRPKAKALCVLGFGDLDHAIDAVSAILTTGPSAVELLDDLIVGLARANTEYRAYVDLMPQPRDGGLLKAVLYVEYFGDSDGEVAERVERLRGVCAALPAHAGCSLQVHTHAGSMSNAWKLRKAGEPLLHGVPGSRKPITFIEDNAIPVERLSEFVRRLREIVAKEGTTAAYYAHASVGVLHVRPLLDIHDDDDRGRMRRIAVGAADLARELGGVMSGEHGDGRVRSPLLERFYGPELMGAFREVKRVFDTRNLLNPGNIVDISGLDARPIESMTQRLRVEPSPQRPASVPTGIETYFDYSDQHGFDGAVEMCNGAGVCRKRQGGTMCPSYMATLDERHSTRGRGNALRLAITGQMPGGAEGMWDDPGTHETLRLCLSCKACKSECPSNVDIARLKAEYLAQRYKRSGPPFASLVMSQVRTLGRVASLLPEVSNAVQEWGIVRWALARVLDIHPERSMPRFSEGLHRAWKRTPPSAASGAPRVVLFGDCFTMFNESGIGLATRRVYEAHGYRVQLADAGCCGRVHISLGLLEQAQRTADATLERLRPFIEDSGVVAILVAEPSCLASIKDDWLSLKLSTERGLREQLARKAFLPEQFLHERWGTHPRTPVYEPPKGETIVHGHCHQKALWGSQTSAGALERVAPGRVRVLDSGCCGMAGSFGYSSDRYELSHQIGEMVLMPAVREAQAKEGGCVAAPGTSCRHQIHDATGHEAQHPVSLLARWLAE